MLYCIVQYYTVLYPTTLYYTILYFTVLYYTLFHTVLYYTIRSIIVHYTQVGPGDRPAPPGGRPIPRCKGVWESATPPSGGNEGQRPLGSSTCKISFLTKQYHLSSKQQLTLFRITWNHQPDFRP